MLVVVVGALAAATVEVEAARLELDSEVVAEELDLVIVAAVEVPVVLVVLLVGVVPLTAPVPIAPASTAVATPAATAVWRFAWRTKREPRLRSGADCVLDVLGVLMIVSCRGVISGKRRVVSGGSGDPVGRLRSRSRL